MFAERIAVVAVAVVEEVVQPMFVQIDGVVVDYQSSHGRSNCLKRELCI